MEKYGTLEIYECAFCHKIQKRAHLATLLNCCEEQCECNVKNASGIKVAKEQWVRRTDLEENEHE
ncbi:MAG: hypothetical protein ACP5N7_05500 [Candidatus Pacearchaeota archaeon]